MLGEYLHSVKGEDDGDFGACGASVERRLEMRHGQDGRHEGGC